MTAATVVRRLDDWINPIAVKEMRQSVSGRFIAWTLIAFLLVQLAIAATVLLFSDVSGQGFNTSRNVFMGHLGVLLGTCLLYLPLSTGIRFSSERSEQNIDLFFITALRPIQIIWGKTLAALVLMLLFFSASMPFMTLTYLLRGLDIPSIFVILAFDFLVVGGCVQLGILLACTPGKVISRGFRLLVGLPILFGAYYLTMQISFGILHSGVGSSMGTWSFWGPALTIAFFAITVIGLLFTVSVTEIAPRSANKALGIRIYLLSIWLACGILALIWSLARGANGSVEAWAVGMILLFGVTLFVSVCERQEVGPRVSRAIPKRKVLRLPAFFLYSGAAGGISFSILMIVGTILLIDLFMRIAPSRITYSTGDDDVFVIALAFAYYTLGYSLTALAIRRIFFVRSQRPNIAIEIILFVLLAGMGIPLAIGLLLHSGPWDTLPSQWYLGNPFAVFWEKEIFVKYLPFAGAWAVGVLAVTLPWLIKQFLNFKPAVPAQMNVLKPRDE